MQIPGRAVCPVRRIRKAPRYDDEDAAGRERPFLCKGGPDADGDMPKNLSVKANRERNHQKSFGRSIRYRCRNAGKQAEQARPNDGSGTDILRKGSPPYHLGGGYGDVDVYAGGAKAAD